MTRHQTCVAPDRTGPSRRRDLSRRRARAPQRTRRARYARLCHRRRSRQTASVGGSGRGPGRAARRGARSCRAAARHRAAGAAPVSRLGAERASAARRPTCARQRRHARRRGGDPRRHRRREAARDRHVRAARRVLPSRSRRHSTRHDRGVLLERRAGQRSTRAAVLRDHAPRRLREFAEASRGRGIIDGLDPDVFATAPEMVAVSFDASAYLERKFFALTAHRSAFGVTPAATGAKPRDVAGVSSGAGARSVRPRQVHAAIPRWPLADFFDGLETARRSDDVCRLGSCRSYLLNCPRYVSNWTLFLALTFARASRNADELFFRSIWPLEKKRKVRSISLFSDPSRSACANAARDRQG